MSTGTGQSDIIPLMQFDFEQQQGSLNDLSSHGIVGTLSNCQPVDDQDMGMCQRFDGSSSYVTCSPTVIHADTAQSSVFENGITITTWVKFDSFPSSGYSYLLQLVGNGGTGISFYTQGNKLNYWSKDKSTSCETSLVTGQWYHLAIAVDNEGNAQFFVDGQPSEQTTKTTLITPILNGSGSKQIIGAWQNANYFAGTMAWMAVYNGAYQQPGILTDLAKGESKRFTSFRQSFPVGFKLNSDDGGAESPILFIESQGEGKDLHLRLQNTGSTPINFYAPSPAVTKASGITDENYHAQLRFRPGILAENYLAENAIDTSLKLGSESGTNWLATLKKDPSGTYSMSFLYTGSSPLPIPPQGEELIIIKEVNASAAQGSRNTNVEFQYQNVLPGKSPVTTGTNATVPMEGHRVQNISIVNHAGVKDIPLRAEVIGPTNVMTYSGASDVTPPESSLQFQLVNTGSKDLDLGLPSSADGATAFTLTIDVQPADYTAEWALIDHGVASKLTLALGDGESGWNADTAGSVPTGNPNQLQWTITNQSANSFAQGEGLTFTLAGIECSLPAGSTVVTIGYRHIPGHWQGAFELPVTKSPLSYTRSKVGVNIQNPEASLHIVEKDGSIPIRIGKNSTSKKLPKPDNGLNYVITSLVPVDNTDNLFYDPLMRSQGYQNPCTINFLSLDNGNPKIQSLPLHQNTNVGTYVTNSGSYFFFLVQNYFQVYELSSDHDQLTFVTGPDITVQTGAPGANSTILGEVCYFQPGATGQILPVNVSNPQSIPDASAQSLPSDIYSLQDFRASANYLYIIGTKNFYVLSQDSGPNASPSGLKLEGSVPYSAGGTVQLYEDIACLVSDNAITLVNIADATSPVISKTISTSNLETSGGVIFYKNFIFISGRGSTSLYAFDLNRENPGDHPIEVNLGTDLSGFWNIGLCSDLIYLSQYSHEYGSYPTGVYSSDQSQFIKLADLYDYLTDRFSYITSKSIGLDVTQLPDNASLSIPYPKDNSSSGLSIGSGYASVPAAISVLVDKISTVDPVSIMSDYGEPILNIIQPASPGGSYRVGIGTDNPKAALHVASNTLMEITDFGYLNNKGAASYFAATQEPPVSIYTEYYMVAFQYFAASDARIKDDLILSDPGQDLSNLLSLKVSDYQYIDIVGKGAGQKKGLIAQQVKEHFPQAVNAANTDFIPDIYAMATDVKWQPITQNLRVSLEKTHDLKVGDKVRLMADKGFEEKEVVAVPDGKSFVISEWEKPVDKLFVFGKEVHDFHTVDYDQVAMLGISAIQALHQKTEVQDERIENLEKENQLFKEELAMLRLELKAFKTALSRQHEN